MALSPIQARVHTHTRKSTHARTVPPYGSMEGENKYSHMDRLIGNITLVLFVFDGGLDHRGGEGAVFDSAFAEVRLGQKLRAHLCMACLL